MKKENKENINQILRDTSEFFSWFRSDIPPEQDKTYIGPIDKNPGSNAASGNQPRPNIPNFKNDIPPEQDKTYIGPIDKNPGSNAASGNQPRPNIPNFKNDIPPEQDKTYIGPIDKNPGSNAASGNQPRPNIPNFKNDIPPEQDKTYIGPIDKNPGSNAASGNQPRPNIPNFKNDIPKEQDKTYIGPIDKNPESNAANGNQTGSGQSYNPNKQLEALKTLKNAINAEKQTTILDVNDLEDLSNAIKKETQCIDDMRSITRKCSESLSSLNYDIKNRLRYRRLESDSLNSELLSAISTVESQLEDITNNINTQIENIEQANVTRI